MSGRGRRPRLPALLLVPTALAVSSLVTLPERAAAAATSSKLMLARLATAPEHPRGYSELPRPRWTDLDGDRCSTKTEVLLRDARKAPDVGSGCELTGGVWIGRYDGLRHRGVVGLAVERMIPLAEAWQSGARRWSAAKRRVFANDLGYRPSLVVLSTTMRSERGDQEPQDWVPDGSPRRCRYLARWVAVKFRWGLAVDPTERDVLTNALADCGWPRAARPGRPPYPVVRGLRTVGVAATSMAVRCAVRSSQPADVVVRFGRAGGRLWRRSSVVTVAPGRTEARLSLRGLLPETAYAFRCTVTTPNTGLVRAPEVLQATTLARIAPASGSPPPTATTFPTSTSSPAPSPPASTSPTTTPVPTTSTPPPTTARIVAVGDMCKPNPTSCIATGNVAASLNPTLYALLGDTQYEKGSATEYANGYAKSSWNALKGKSLPAIGNHEILTANAAGYCGYFFTVSACPLWYAYDVDANWRAVVLDSNKPANATQLAWLDAELAKDTSRNLLVYWHHPRWRNSGHADSSVDVLMRRAYAAHADIVLWGHDHMYTQWAKLGPNGPAANGFKAFTVGTGGADEVKPANTSYPGTVRNLVEFGVLELTLRANDYSWRFVNTSGATKDSGSDTVTP